MAGSSEDDWSDALAVASDEGSVDSCVGSPVPASASLAVSYANCSVVGAELVLDWSSDEALSDELSWLSAALSADGAESEAGLLSCVAEAEVEGPATLVSLALF